MNALSRNFGNLSNHLEQMSFDLANDVNLDFKVNYQGTRELIRNLNIDIIRCHEDVVNCKKITENTRESYIRSLKKVEDFKN
jgi:hypothetical protein